MRPPPDFYRISVRIPAELCNAMLDAATYNGLSIQAFARLALRHYMNGVYMTTLKNWDKPEIGSEPDIKKGKRK